MEKRFKNGDELYLMVTVHDTEPTGGYDYTVEWKDAVDGMNCLASVGQAQLVSDADFGTSIDWQAKYNEYNEKAEAKIKELATRLNGMAESLKEAQAKAVSLNSALKAQDSAYADVVSKNAALTKQNRELEEKLSSGKGDVEHWRTKYMNMKKSRNEYKRVADHLKEERDRADDELALTRIMNVALAEKIERMQNNG